MAFSYGKNDIVEDVDDVVRSSLVCSGGMFDDTREMLSFIFSDSIAANGIRSVPTDVSEWAVPDKLLQLSDDDVQIDYRNKLGSGAFCTVYPVHLKNTSGGFDTSKPPLALKKLNLHIQKDEKIVKHATLDLKREADILSKIAHENIIQIYGQRKRVQKDPKDSSFFMVIGVLSDTLESKLVTWKKNRGMKKFTPHDSVISRLEGVAMGISKGMAFLHSKKIIYRDLKPDNIGFDRNRVVKIFDFGLAQDLSGTATTIGRIGTLRYMAPEVAAREKYGLKADVFSFAILLWEMVTSRVPYETEISNFTAGTPQIDGKRPSMKYVESKEVQELLEKIWAAKSEDRLSFKETCVEMDKIIKMQPTTQKGAASRKQGQPKKKMLRSLFSR